MEFQKGDVLVLKKGNEVKERMIVRRFGKFHSLDTYTGNIVDINDLHIDVVVGHDSADSIVEAYRKKGYTVELKG